MAGWVDVEEEHGWVDVPKSKQSLPVVDPNNPSGLIRRTIGDITVGLAKGAAKLPQIVTGLADIPTSGAVGKFVEEQTGYSGKAVDEALDKYLTPETRAANKKVADADGFFDTIGAALANPSSIVQATAESLPSMFAGGMLGRAVAKGAGLMKATTAANEAVSLAAKAGTSAPALEAAAAKRILGEAARAGGIGEGTVMAGQSVENMREQSADGLITPAQALAGAAIGAVGGAIGTYSSRVATKLGIVDPDALIAGGAAGRSAREALAEGVANGAAKRLTMQQALKQIGEGAFTEGVLEEMPQSAMETILQNVASDKPWDEGLGNSMAMGLVTGAAMGAGVNAGSAAKERLGQALGERQDAVENEAYDEMLANRNTPPPAENQAIIEALPSGTIADALNQNSAVEVPQEKADDQPLLDATKKQLADPSTTDYAEQRAALEARLETASDADAPKIFKAIESIDKQEGKDNDAFDKSAIEVDTAANDVSTAQAKFADKSAAIDEKSKALQQELDEINKAPRVEPGKETKKAARERIALSQESLQGDLAIEQQRLDQVVTNHQKAIDKHAQLQETANPITLTGQPENTASQEPLQAPNEAYPIVTPSLEGEMPSTLPADVQTQDTPELSQIGQPEAPIQAQSGQTLDMLGLQQTYEAIAPHIRSFSEKAITVAKDFADYSKRMISKFGKAIVDQLQDMWNYATQALAPKKTEAVDGEAAGSRGSFSWARKADDGYEVSSKGDKRFSALSAKLKDGRTIEEAYQLDIKGYRKDGNDWRLGKGKAPAVDISKDDQWNQYKDLWNTYLNENPKLEADLRVKAEGKPLTDMFASTEISQARALSELLNERKGPKENGGYVNHSGGASGADTEWDTIGRGFGFSNHNHYREPGKTGVDSKELSAAGVKPVQMTKAEWDEGTIKADQAAKDMGRPAPSQQRYGFYAIRNWLQVKNADAVYAVSTLVKPGERDPKGFVNQTNNTVVAGGTGYATQMAINEGKPVYVFDKVRKKWFKNIDGMWSATETPALTSNYAGIGSREMTPEARQAIKDVYEKTVAGKAEEAKPVAPKTEAPNSIPGFDNRYEVLVKQKQAHKEGNVYYLHNESDSKEISSSNARTGTIMINHAKAAKAFLRTDYPERVPNESKQKMYDLIGVTPAQFMKAFKSLSEYKAFLIRHEEYHNAGNEGVEYPRLENGKVDVNHPTAIEIEAAATLHALTSEQKKRIGLDVKDAPKDLQAGTEGNVVSEEEMDQPEDLPEEYFSRDDQPAMTEDEFSDAYEAHQESLDPGNYPPSEAAIEQMKNDSEASYLASKNGTSANRRDEKTSSATISADGINNTSIQTLALLKGIEDYKLRKNSHPIDLRSKVTEGERQIEAGTAEEKASIYNDKNKQSDNAFTGRTEESIEDSLHAADMSDEEYAQKLGISATSDYFSAFEDDGYGTKMPAKKVAPSKDVAGQLIDKMDSKESFTNRDLDEIIVNLESAGLFSPTQSEILRDDVERWLDRNEKKELTLKRLMSMVREILALEEESSDDGTRSDWLQDVLEHLDDENELGLADDLETAIAREELRAPEFRTVAQANSYYIRRTLSSIDKNSPKWVNSIVEEMAKAHPELVVSGDAWVKKAMTTQAYIAEAIKRDNKLIATNKIMLAGLEKKLKANKNLAEYNKEYTNEDGEVVLPNEVDEFMEMLYGLSDYEYDVQPIASDLFKQYSSFDSIESLPMADLTELYDRLTVSDRYLASNPNEEGDLSQLDLEERYLTAKYGYRDTVKSLPKKEPSQWGGSLQARYDRFKKTIDLYKKADAVVDAYLDVIDTIMREPYHSAHVIGANTVVKKLISVKKVGDEFVPRYPEIAAKYGKRKERYNKQTKGFDLTDEYTYSDKAKAELRSIVTELRGHSYLAEHHTQDVIDEEFSDETLAETIEATYDLNGEASGANILETPKDVTKDVNVSDPIIPIGGRLNVYDIVFPKQDGEKFSRRITVDKKGLEGFQDDIDSGLVTVEPHSKPENAATVPLFRYIADEPDQFGKRVEIYFTAQAIKLGKNKTKNGSYSPMKDHPYYKVNNDTGSGVGSAVEIMWGSGDIDVLLPMYQRFIDDSVDSPAVRMIAEKKQLEADARALGTSLEDDEELARIRREIKSLTKQIFNELAPARNAAMKLMIRNSRVLDEQFFAKLTVKYNKMLGLTGKERLKEEALFKLYEDNGYNADSLIVGLNRMASDIINERAKQVYMEVLSGVVDPLALLRADLSRSTIDPLAVLRADLSNRELKLLNDYVAHAKITPKNNTANPFPSNALAKEKDATYLKAKFDAILGVEARLRIIAKQESSITKSINKDDDVTFGSSADTDFNKGIQKDIKKLRASKVNREALKKEELARLARESGVEIISNEMADMYIEEVFSDEHFVNTTTDDVSEYGAGLTHAESMKSPIAQLFFEKLANLFGADLVLVKGNGFTGKYVPKASDGRAKIVINPFMKTGLARVFAHELFHHIFNKVSPTAYRVFQAAIRESIDQKKFDEAVRKALIEKKFLTPAERYTMLQSFESNQTHKMSTTSVVTKGTFKHDFADRRTKDTARIPNNGNLQAKDSPLIESKFKARVKDLGAQGTDQITGESEAYEAAKAAIEEEIYANIFAQAFHQKTFWDTLSKTVEGQGVATELLIHAAKQSSKILKFISSLNEKTDGYDHMNNRFVASLVTNWTGRSVISVKDADGTYHNEVVFEGGVNQILAELVSEALKSTRLRHESVKELTNIAGSFVGEAKQKVLTHYLSKTKGTTGYRGLMTAIEAWGNDILDFINWVKPESWFADYRVNPAIMRIMQDQNHAGNQAAQEAHARVEEFAHVFADYDKKKFQDLHDAIVRERDPKKQKEAFDALPPEVQAVFNIMGEYAKGLHEQLVEAGVLKPEQYRANHYGQTIKWFRESGQAVYDTMLSFMSSEDSVFKGDDNFTGSKSKKSTAEIEAEGYTTKTLNPIDMFTKYVEDATSLITLNKTLQRLEAAGLMKRSVKDSDTLVNQSVPVYTDVPEQRNGKVVKNPDGSIRYEQKKDENGKLVFEKEYFVRLDDPAFRVIQRFNQINKGKGGTFKIRIEGHPEDYIERDATEQVVEEPLVAQVDAVAKKIWDEYTGIDKNWLEDLREHLADQELLIEENGEEEYESYETEMGDGSQDDKPDYPTYSLSETILRKKIIDKMLAGEVYSAPVIEPTQEERLTKWLEERKAARKAHPDSNWHYYSNKDDASEQQYLSEADAQEAMNKLPENIAANATIARVSPDTNQTIAYYKLIEEKYLVKNMPVKVKDRVTGKLKTIQMPVEFITAKKEIGTAKDKESAAGQAYDPSVGVKKKAGQMGTRVKAVAVWQEAKTTAEHNMFFDQDVAKLFRVMLSRDHIREWKYGNKMMSIKNAVTMFELALSPFHWMTITQELVASSMAVARGEKGFKNKLKAFSPKAGFNRARDMKLLFKKVMKDNAYAETPEGKAETLRLLGTNDISILDVWKGFAANGGMISKQDESLRSGLQNWGVSHQIREDGHFDLKVAFDSIAKTHAKIHEETGNKLVAYNKEVLFHSTVTLSAYLMEEVIPRVKAAAYATEMAKQILNGQAKLGRKMTEDEKSDIARDTMKFVEDRFGEVNWKNMWLSKTNKTALQAAFRSFTWVAGSWKAMAKSGFDLVKWGWFNVKNIGTDKEYYELGDKGYWGLMAIATHLITVQAMNLVMLPAFMAAGDDGEEDDESVGMITKLMFPRTDPFNNTKRMTFGSYPAEAFKHLSHLGIIGDSPHPSKIWTGRMAGPIGKAYEALWANETFDGVTIHDSDDPIYKQFFDAGKHLLLTPIPMSLGGAWREATTRGLDTQAGLKMMGFSNAPASTMRSRAANLAFEIGRQEYKGKKVTPFDMEVRNELKRAMVAYSNGDKSKVDELLREGRVSQRKYEMALTRQPTIDGQPNPLYKDQLSQALSNLTVSGALKVFQIMTAEEKAKHAREMQKKINNMKLRKEVSPQQQDILIEKWNKLNDI